MLRHKIPSPWTRTIAIFGWYGVGAILTAYALVSFSIVPPGSIAYQFLNISGSLGLIVEAYSRRDVQPAVLNIIWVLIGLIALLHII